MATDPDTRSHGDWSQSGGGPLVAPEVSRRVRAILDGVEREAAQLRAEARDEARRYLDQARRYIDGLVADRQQRIASLSDEIIARTEGVLARLEEAEPVRIGFENLVRSLGDAAERLAVEVEDLHLGPSEAPPYWPSSPQAAPEQWSTPAPAPYPPPPPGAGAQQPYGDARPAPPPPPPASAPPPPAQPPRPTPHAVAVQMAGAGNTRGQIGDYLRRYMGVADPTAMLDDLFGRGTPDDARVPWNS